MKKRNMYKGIMIGTSMLMAVSNTAFAAGAAVPKGTGQTQTTVTVAEKENKKDSLKTEIKDAKAEESVIYGKVVKADKDKLEIAVASMIWDAEKEKEQLDEAKKEEKTQTKDKEKDQDKKQPGDMDQPADFETDTMKWKADGQTVFVVLDKNVQIYQEVIAEVTKQDKAANAEDKDKKDEKKTKQDEKKNTDVKHKKLDKLEEGAFVKITLKEKSSLEALEILALANVTENVEKTPEKDKQASDIKTKEAVAKA